MNNCKRCSLILAFILIFVSYGNVFATGTDTNTTNEDIQVLLNNEALKFEASPVLINGSVMVPMRQIFEYLGAQVDWKAETQTVVGYRRYKNSSNIFIKLRIGEDYAYNNGRKIKLLAPPTIVDGRTMVPVRFVAESFGLHVDWNPMEKVVTMSNSGDINEGKKTIDYTEYKPRFFDHGVKIMIPDYWNKLEDENSFGFFDEFEKIQMDVYAVEMDSILPLDYILEEYKFILNTEYGDNVTIYDNSISNINNINVAHINTEVKTGETTQNQIHFFFIANDSIYRVTFKFTKIDDDTYYEDIIKNVISTVEISSQTFNTNDEHYFEYDAFFNNVIELSIPISANKIVESKFLFNGKIGDESDIKYLKATVTKGDKTKDFEIDVIDKSFYSVLYTPFGLGKHNITIKASLTDGTEKLMQFSVVNMNVTDITYLLPSKYIDILDEETITTANLLTKDIDQERDRALAIFEFVVKNINRETYQNMSIRKSSEVLEDKSGSSKEMTYLYAAMVRSTGIPCKIFAGMNQSTTHYWTQVMVNGHWVLVDVARGSGKLDSNDYFVKADYTYFNKDKITYMEEFENIICLDD